jgi:hypothetical protein
MGEFLRLRPKNLFAIITDAAFQDATIEPYEQEILKNISTYLKLDRKLATAIAVRSRIRYEEGKLGPEVPLDRKVVYQHALETACADGKIDEIERQLLDAIRRLFKITPEFHNSLLKSIQAALIEKTRQEKLIEAEKETSVKETMKTANINVEKNITSENTSENDDIPLLQSSNSTVEPLLPSQVKESIAAKAASILADIDGWDEGDGKAPVAKTTMGSCKMRKISPEKKAGLITSIGKWFKGN